MPPRNQPDRLTDAASPSSAQRAPLSAPAASIARSALRVVILCVTLLEIVVRFALLRLRRGSDMALPDRAGWLHQSCRLILRRAGIPVDLRGPRPIRGLICANHLSYLDILVLSAAAPCVFVAKREIEGWPAVGFFARCAGTIFLDRESRGSADAAAAQMSEAMATGVPVLLFPEGVSTDGSQVLRFHPTLLEPAILGQLEIAPAAVGWRHRGGEERDLCYYGDISFLPHLLRTLSRSGISAELDFYPEALVYPERKAAALDLHDKVEAMRRRMIRDLMD
jgi:1-acyl-sn-glycerol-3-phosphate acyltransferase